MSANILKLSASSAHKPDNGIEEEEDISALEASDSRGISVRSPVLAIA
jgi:hypothetical protein